MPSVICQSCSCKITAKPELEETAITCPQCRASVKVERIKPNHEVSQSDNTPHTKGYLKLLLALIVACATGGAGGFILGHLLGKSVNGQDIADLKAKVESADEMLRAALADAKSIKDQLRSLIAERNSLMTSLKRAEEEITNKVNEQKKQSELKKENQSDKTNQNQEPGKKKLLTIDFGGDAFIKRSQFLSNNEIAELKRICTAIEQGEKQYELYSPAGENFPLIARNLNLFQDKDVLFDWLSNLKTDRSYWDRFQAELAIDPSKLRIVKASFLLLNQDDQGIAAVAANFLKTCKTVGNIPDKAIQGFIISHPVLFDLDK